MRYYIKLSYDGTNYSGWQWQANAGNTVQSILTCRMESILKANSLPITGCGRTDSGVHADEYFAQFDHESELDLPKIVHIANIGLPADIAIHTIFPVSERANARYDATSRTYKYHLHRGRNVFKSRISQESPLDELDVALVKKACQMVGQYSDFATFCNTPQKHNTTICDIMLCEFDINNSSSEAIFTIKANRFLKSMVRILVHEILAVGYHQLPLDHFIGLLQGTHQRPHHLKAYPNGLHLHQISYAYRDESWDLHL